MRKIVRQLHRWLGFPLGLLFLLTFGTGLLTAIDELLERRSYPGFHYQESSAQEIATALETLRTQHPRALFINLPSEQNPYYQVQQRGEKFTYAIGKLAEPQHETLKEGGFFATVLQLHRNYLLGKAGLFGIEGAHYAAWVALLALLISTIGLWLWWPVRGSFNLKKLVPTKTKRSNFYFSHMSAGVVTFALILLMALSGASITFRAVAQSLLGVNSSAEKIADVEIALDNNWQAWLSAVNKAIPNAKLTRVQFPSERGAAGKPGAPANPYPDAITFRVQAPGDWLGLPSSKVLIDSKKSALVETVIFKELPFGEKIYSVLKPLHTGKGLPAAYLVLLLFMSALGTVMVLSGVLSFILKKRKWSLRARFSQPATSRELIGYDD